MISNLYWDGQLYAKQAVEVIDHDWASLAAGVAIPHGLWDLTYNIGYIQMGTSHDTSEFACDSIDYWWNTYGKFLYADAPKMLLLCDGGGNSSLRHYLFKQNLQTLTNDLGITMRIAPYPSYTSKYNPIEHRLVPHVTQACQGVIFESMEIVKELMVKATTKTGLKVFTTIIDKTYQTGRKIVEELKETMQIVFDELLASMELHFEFGFESIMHLVVDGGIDQFQSVVRLEPFDDLAIAAKSTERTLSRDYTGNVY